MKFWSRQELVTHQNGFHEPQFRATRGTTQGELALPIMFNVSVESVIRHWMSLTVEDEQATHEGLWIVVGKCMVLFYADDGMIISRDPEWPIKGLSIFSLDYSEGLGLWPMLQNIRPFPASQGQFARGCRRRISVGGSKNKGPFTKIICGGASHNQTMGWS